MISFFQRLLTPVSLALFVFTQQSFAEIKATEVKKLQPYKASYSATLSNIPVDGKAVRTLTQNKDGSWILTFKADMLLYSFSEESHFRFKDGEIQPFSYLREKGALGRKNTSEITFDWGKKIADSREDSDRWKVTLKPEDLDRISYQQQLQYDLSNGKKEFTYNVINEDERDQYTFKIEGEEILETPAGRFATVRLKMVRDNNKRQTWIWLAKDWDDLLVQLKQREKKKDYVVSLRQAEIAGKEITPLPIETTKK
ncbi:DUF3108 domain-containing protein [Sansalvadorimonas sp. 2012CJ34-2]|uniref:DUF3108 domain-containing protein n=1 Tax=Parendozoicomonas callyspongiae TaxID=2942213 RepID=A0ABT0PH54_9GAMM|nr:DUF3108 domain-containing protein [Sansalvadorimonas sp. 2012CJ34-2]MCL6270668.1 DUF3108 domain-containing protein [Sansalvadorimonas sp. 2012CJ34-2]